MGVHRKSPTILPAVGELDAMLRKGMTQTEIASIFCVTVSAINVKLRRAGFSPTRDYGGARKHTGNRVISQRQGHQTAAILEQYPAPPTTKHADRVTRVTFSGAHVTMPRLTFLDGPAHQGEGE